MEADEKKKDARRRRSASPSGMLCTDSVILRGEQMATVYGCRRILRYSERAVCLALKKRCVCVEGEGLVCTSFSAGTVTVEGLVTAVRYCAGACEGGCAHLAEVTK